MARFEFGNLAHSLETTRGLHHSSFGTVFGEIQGQPLHVGSGTDNSGNKVVGNRDFDDPAPYGRVEVRLKF